MEKKLRIDKGKVSYYADNEVNHDLDMPRLNEVNRLIDRVTALEAEVKRLASRKVCQECGGSGELTDTHYVTRDMAIDAGDRSMEGMPIDDNYPCGNCNGTGYIDD